MLAALGLRHAPRFPLGGPSPMAATPLPREPLSGTCDASGNATLKYRAPAHFYVHCYIAVAVSAGSPSYIVTLGGSTSGALVYGQGNQTQLGPVLLQPGEVVQIMVFGANNNATVAGQVVGWQAAQPEELLPLLPLQPTAVTLTTPAVSGLSSGTLVNQGDTVSLNCAGAAVVSVQITSGTIAAGTIIAITGSPDGTTYYDLPIFQPQSNGRWADGSIGSTTFSSYGLLLVPVSGLAGIRIAMTTKGGGQGSLPVILRAAAAAIFPPSISQQLMAQSQPVVIASDQSAVAVTPFGSSLGQKTMANSMPVVIASDQSAVATLFPSNARTAFAATANAAAGVVAEAMLQVIPVRAGVAGAGVTSIAVTAGKKLRLTAIVCSFLTGAAALNVSRFFLRTNPSGAVVITSPLLWVIELAPPSATSGVGNWATADFPDGMELSGTDQVGISHIAGAVTNTEWVALVGFEY